MVRNALTLGIGSCIAVLLSLTTAIAQSGTRPPQGPTTPPRPSPSDPITFPQPSPSQVPVRLPQPSRGVPVRDDSLAKRPRGGCGKCIEPPSGGSVTIELLAIGSPAKGVVKVFNEGEFRIIFLVLSDLPNDVGSYYLYAIDPEGQVTLLGKVDVINGAAKVSFKTTLAKFMVLLSPDPRLTSLQENSKITLTSERPDGDVKSTLSELSEALNYPESPKEDPLKMLNVPAMKRGEETELKILFLVSWLAGAQAIIRIEPHESGPTTIKMRFLELKDPPPGTLYSLWAVSPSKQFVKLAEVGGGAKEREIEAQTTLEDFGFLFTLEAVGAKDPSPNGKVIRYFFGGR